MERKKEGKEIIESKAPISSLSPLISNVTAVHSHPDMLLIDFGFYAPDYTHPHDLVDSQIARICVLWDAAEALAERLNEVVTERKKEQKSKAQSTKKAR